MHGPKVTAFGSGQFRETGYVVEKSGTRSFSCSIFPPSFLGQVVTNTRAVEVRDGSVDLQAKDKGANKVTVPCGMTVWTGGTEPRPLTSQLLDALSKGGGESQEQRAAEPGKVVMIRKTEK